MVRAITSLSVMLFFAGCISQKSSSDVEPSAKYFASPEQSVEVTTRLLKSENWKELASYYDLAGTTTPRSDLESGKFFLRTERPANAHPGLDWRIREPFTPGFKFERVTEPAIPGLMRVDVSIAIDQGGRMVQRGMESFMLRKSDRGYQLVPKAR